MAAVRFREEIIVSRPPDPAVPSAVALTHFDLFWLRLTAQRLFFYAVDDLSTSHFSSTVLPALTSSLSLTLRHYFPLSGRLIVSSCSSPSQQLPYIRCTDGDSVSVAVCESEMDFNHLAGDGGRRLDQLKALVPKSPPPDNREDTPLLAVQITVFPSSGFSIGLTYSHAAADGRAIVSFIKSWASVCKTGEIDPNCVPVHSRDLISDPDNKIATTNVEVCLSSRRPPPPQSIDPKETFRYTFVIGSVKVNEMKTWVTRKLIQDEVQEPPVSKVSTFMVTCALIWVCLQETRQTIDHDEITIQKYFLFLADLRQRLNLPGNYFGNCLRKCEAAVKMAELVGDDGVYEAAKAIGSAITEMEREGMKGVEGWRKRAAEILRSGHGTTIAGSPKFGVYECDFGWGRPRKAEYGHIESSGSFAIAESRSEVGAVEITVALSPLQFQRFNHAFHRRPNCINHQD